MSSLSSTENETDSPWVPSRRVVSKVKIFIISRRPWPRGGASALFLRYSGFFLLLQERHHLAQFAAHFFDGLIAGSFAHGQELVAAGFVFVDPLAREFAGLDFGQDLLHLGAHMLVDDARAAGVIAVLGGIGNRVTHVAQAAFLDQVDDQLELVQAFEIGDFGRITGFHQGLETGADQLGRAAAQHGLLAEQIALGLFLECGARSRRLSGSPAQRVCQCGFERMSGGVLMHGDQGRNAHAFGEQLAHTMAGRFRRDHGNIHIRGRLDLPK